MTYIDRYISIYPGVRKHGVVFWEFRRGIAQYAMFGSLTTEELYKAIKIFDPKKVYYSYKESDLVKKNKRFMSEDYFDIALTHPQWSKSPIKVPLTIRDESPLTVSAAYKIGFFQLFKKNKIRLQPIRLVQFSWAGLQSQEVRGKHNY